MVGKIYIPAALNFGKLGVITISFGEYFKQAIEVVKLNEKAISKAAKDSKATNMAILFYAIGGLLAGIASFNLIAVVLAGVMTAGMSFIAVGILHVIAKIFGGKGQYMELYRPMGLGSVVGWVAAIPLIGWLLSLWNIVVTVTTVKTVHKLTTGKAVLVVLLPIIIIGAIAFILALTVLAFLVPVISEVTMGPMV